MAVRVFEHHRPLRAFSSKQLRLQVLDYIVEQEAIAREGDATGRGAALKLMWGAIRLLAQSKGSFKSVPEQGGRVKAGQPGIGPSFLRPRLLLYLLLSIYLLRISILICQFT